MSEKKKKKTYTALPEVPEALKQRYAVVLAVQSGQMTVAGGARELGMSRNHFQSMLHRGLEGLLEGVSPKRAGRPAVPEAQAKLAADNERLRRENEKLKAQVANTHQMIELVADVFNRRIERVTTTKKSREPRSKPSETKETTGDDPEEDLRASNALRERGLRAELCAAVIGRGASTLRRWRWRARNQIALCAKRAAAKRASIPSRVHEQVESLVRDLHGLIGADALRHEVEGVSRRQAMAIKRSTLTAMERERRASCERVHITTPSIVRGMDAMYQMTTDGFRWLLIFGDASVPYRTSAPVVDAYDSKAVAHAIESDFRKNGAPLVLRMDRASCHRTDEVARVLAAHGVLALHGPPHHPGFYGQLERQNRDHRAWLRALGMVQPQALSAHVEHMRVALNEHWPRRMLGFQTAAEHWNRRPVIHTNRDALAQEVQHHASHYRRRNVSDDVAQRLAIEKTLTNQGWLRREVGGWC